MRVLRANQNVLSKIGPTIRTLSEYRFFGLPILESILRILTTMYAYNLSLRIFGKNTPPVRTRSILIPLVFLVMSAAVSAAKSGRDSLEKRDFYDGGTAFAVGFLCGLSGASGWSAYISRQP